MKRISKITGLAIAAAAASLATTGCSTLCGGEEAPVKCFGANACKGATSCATPDNSCKAQNSCKGQGWVYMPNSECLSKGGSVMD